MAIIRWKVGYENSVIAEKTDFESSIFFDQYRLACSLVEGFVRRSVENSLQIVAFCGPRGSGKTSCMTSVRNLIDLTQSGQAADTENFFKEAKLRYLPEKLRNHDLRFEIPAMIDPSFFDEDNNIIELLIGQIYGDLQKYERDNRFTIDRLSVNKVYDALSGIKECLLTVHGSPDNTFNRYSELSVLASAVRLRESLRDLVTKYLDLKRKQKLLVIIDDLDLNRTGAYEMCEQIRKYLAFPECVVFLSFDYNQMIDSLSEAFKHSQPDSDDKRSIELATRYLDKLVASGERVHTPSTYNFCDRVLRIVDGKTTIQWPSGEDKVKDVVVSLIFQKTRFLFYNSKGGVSPIIPNNLRELFQLLSILWNLPDLPDDKESPERRAILEMNKSEFKIYFFNYWTKYLDFDTRKKVTEIVNTIPHNILNQYLVKLLNEKFSEELKRNYNISEEEDSATSTSGVGTHALLQCISSGNSFSYNVSVGDLFYLINLLQKDDLSPEKDRLLFFIRSYYSILLFEAYDVVTEGDGERYPGASTGSSIYRVDRRFDHTNELQRLVNGAFFTYHPGELIKNSKDGERIDTCVIRSKDALLNIFRKAKECMVAYNDPETAPDKPKVLRSWFRLAEFFVFTISRSIIQKEVDDFNDGKSRYRESVVTSALNPFNSQMGYYVMDVLNPFYALVNPEFTYRRFDKLAGIKDGEESMFDFALRHDFSLLRNMLAKAHGGVVSDKDIADPERRNRRLGRLQSDAVIRNGEVLMAVLDNAVGERDRDHDTSSRTDKLIALYRLINTSGLTTHRLGRSEDDPLYNIDFTFLQALIDFLSEDLGKNSIAEVKDAFDKVFTIAPDPESKTDSDNKNDDKSKKKTIRAYDPLVKAQISQRLERIVGNKPNTAAQIKAKLVEKIPELGALTPKDMNRYVKTKPNNLPYTLTQLTEYILKNPERSKAWSLVLGLKNL